MPTICMLLVPMDHIPQVTHSGGLHEFKLPALLIDGIPNCIPPLNTGWWFQFL